MLRALRNQLTKSLPYGNITMKRIAALLTLAAATTGLTYMVQAQSTQPSGETLAFNFTDPKGVNAVLFLVDSQLEPIMGMATGISGAVNFDPTNPESLTGTILIDTKSVKTSNARMASVLHGADWIAASENPTISFTFDSAKIDPASDNGKTTLTVDGKLSVAGITLDKTVNIEPTFIKDGAAERGGADAGDLLVLRSVFTISRQDFGIKKDMPDTKVGSDITIMVAIVGYTK